MSENESPAAEGWFDELRSRAETALCNVDERDAPCMMRDVDRLLHEVRVSQLELEMQNEELRRAYTELQITNDKYSDLYDFAPVAYFTMDPTGTIQEGNLAGAALLGFGKNELVGKLLVQFVEFQDRDAYRRHRRRVISSMGRHIGEFHMARRDGAPFHARLECVALRNQSGDILGSRTVISDITDRKHAEDALFREKERAQITLHSIGDGVITTTADAVVEFLNPAAEALTGWSNEKAIGKPLDLVFRIIDERSRKRMADPVKRCLRSGRIAGLAHHSLLLSRTGQEFAVQNSAAPIRDRTGAIVGAVLVFQDVTEARRIATEIAHQANHDPLTGLVNRREFERRMENALLRARMHDAQHVLCYIDLDRFKVVNDSAGHVAGDELLRQVAALLMRQVRARDTVARLGGDEFCLLLENCPLETGLTISEGLVAAIRQSRFFWEGRAFEIGASAGLVPIEQGSEDTRRLLTDADVACYTAKDLGRNRVHIHPNYAHSVADPGHSLVGLVDLQKALEAGRFRLFCQPIHSLRGDARPPRQYEILLRLPNGGERMLAPDAFIPTAERYGVMPSIDRWVIHDAFRRIGAMMFDPLKPGIAVNLSGSSLSDGTLLDFILGEIRDTSFPPDRLCFEITETAAIQNLTHATRLILKLREQGCRFALDDFGKGLSSLSYLKHLPVDFLKIDGSFIRDIVREPADRAMVSAVNQLAHAMNIETIAECVECPTVIEELRSLGVDYIQGYAIGEPIPLETSNIWN